MQIVPIVGILILLMLIVFPVIMIIDGEWGVAALYLLIILVIFLRK